MIGDADPEIDHDWRMDRGGPADRVRSIFAEVLRYAIKNLRQSKGASDAWIKRRELRATAAVFLASNRSAPWFDFLGLDQGRVLRAVNFPRWARHVLEDSPKAHLSEREIEVVAGVVEYLEDKSRSDA